MIDDDSQMYQDFTAELKCYVSSVIPLTFVHSLQLVETQNQTPAWRVSGRDWTALHWLQTQRLICIAYQQLLDQSGYKFREACSQGRVQIQRIVILLPLVKLVHLYLPNNGVERIMKIAYISLAISVHKFCRVGCWFHVKIILQPLKMILTGLLIQFYIGKVHSSLALVSIHILTPINTCTCT